MESLMPEYELCGKILEDLKAGLPLDPAAIPSYALAFYHRYLSHSCFPDLTREISNLLTTRCSEDEFFWFCDKIGDPSLIVNPVLIELEDLMAVRAYEQATDLIAYILPYGLKAWPDSKGQDVRSFRDLIEYSYYMTVCQPEHDVVAAAFLQTDILYLHGLLLAGKRDDNEAIIVLQTARHQSPVHAGILGLLVEVLLRNNRIEEAVPLLTRSFKCAWIGEDLAHAYRNQGFLCTLEGDDEAAITCYLMAETWDELPDGGEELLFLARKTVMEIDTGYYNVHGTEILSTRGIPVGPDSEIISLLIGIAEDYLEEQNFFSAREYLIRAHLLLMSDELEEKIHRIEQFMEDQVDF